MVKAPIPRQASAKASFAWSRGRTLPKNLAYGDECILSLAKLQRSWLMVTKAMDEL